jgi:3-isopropylmalate/(R)-2-methylmalate dehydratase small subunit
MAIERIRRLDGAGLPLTGSNIDTDRIIPARFLRAVSFEGLERHLFEDDIAQARLHPLVDPKFAGATLLVVNDNFGCGSSREHAPQAIRRRGFRGVIGESFSEIFFGNSVALGMPCVTASADDVRALQEAIAAAPATEIGVDLEALAVTFGGRSIGVALPPAARDAFLEGTWDATGLLLDRFEEVRAVADRLPYLREWA